MKQKNKKKTKFVDKRININIKDQFKTVDIGIKDGIFVFSNPLTLGEMAAKLNKPSAELIKYFFMQGRMLTINHMLSIEQIGELCLENNLDFKIEKEVNTENILDNLHIVDTPAELKKRPPIVTIMGHVDHGKTTLLDKIRKTNVTASEAGGITQHIGAYQVNYKNSTITFIDTPGHEAFSQMRSRGADLTDIIVLVVAADDGLKPQTEEAIDHAKFAKIPIIVFVNKMDKENANVEKVTSQLSEKDVLTEEWGGDTIFIQGSALQGTGVDKLLSAIETLAEVLDLKANPDRLSNGVVIESKLDKGFGPIATILVKNGTLRKGDFIVAGSTHGKVRSLQDENGLKLDTAPPSRAVVVVGLDNIPSAGDKFLCLKDEKEAKEIADKIKTKLLKKEQFEKSNGDLRNKINSGELKNINLIIKADVNGSLEVIKSVISKININGVTATIIRAAIGGITESDVRLAQTSGGMLIGFNIRPSKDIQTEAVNSKVNIETYNIIYKLKEDLEQIFKGSLDAVYKEEVIGSLEVVQIWKHSTIGTICGCKVTDGKIKRNDKCHIIRNSVVVYSSTISSLKHGKDQINETSAGKECGVTIKNFTDIKEGDVIEVYKDVQKTYEEIANNESNKA